MDYGLETVHLTSSLLKKLDGFQLHGLRKIIGISTAFIDGANTNRAVIQRHLKLLFRVMIDE